VDVVVRIEKPDLFLLAGIKQDLFLKKHAAPSHKLVPKKLE